MYGTLQYSVYATRPNIRDFINITLKIWIGDVYIWDIPWGKLNRRVNFG